MNFNTNLNIRILQFGEGNFLRAFIGDLVDELNSKTIFNGGIVVVQPIPKGLVDLIESQKGVYTLFLNGIENGETIQRHKRIDSIVACNNPYEDFSSYLKLAHIDSFHFIVSNTTEAGITYDPDDQFLDRPPNSFPAKLTRWLWERWFHFQGNNNAGVSIIPCELINNNADTLKEIIFKYVKVWALESAFSDWLKNACTFHNSLVDRIVSGYPKEN